MKDIILTSGGLVFQQVAQFLVGIYVANQLGSAEYGTVSVARSIINLLITVMPLGLDLALLKFLPQNGQSEDEHRTNMRPFLRIVAAVNASAMLVLVASAGLLQAHVYQYSHFALYFSLTAVSLPALSLIAVYGAFYRTIGRPGQFAVIGSFVQTALRSAFNLLAVTIGLGAAGVAGGTSLAAGLALVYAWYSVRARHAEAGGASPTGRIAPPSRDRICKVLGEAKWMAASLFVGGLTRSADIIVLGIFMPSVIVGSYSALSMVAYIVSVYPITLSQTMGPQVARLYNEGRLEEITRVQSLYITSAAIIGSFLFAGIAAFGPRLKLLLGPSFDISPTLAVLLPLSYLVSATLSPMGFALSMTGQHRRELFVMAGGGILMVVLLFVLVPPFAGIGAASAVVLAFSISNILRFLFVARHIGNVPGRLRDFLPPLASLLAAFAAKNMSDHLLGADLIGSFMGCVLYSLAFAAMTWWMFLDPAGRQKMVAALARRRG